LGEIYHGKYILRKTAIIPPVPRIPHVRPETPVQPVLPVNRIGRPPLVGLEDALEDL
jgi:hypothetical protein